MPNYLISWSTNKVILRNYEGVITTYQEPDSYEQQFCDRRCDVARRIGRRVEIITTEWDGILAGLLARQYDAIIGSMAITPEREQVVAFTQPYYISGAQLFVHRDSLNVISSMADCAGQRIGVVLGETYEHFLRDHYPEVIAVAYKGTPDIFQDLDHHRLSGFITDTLVGAWQIRSAAKPFVPVGDLLYQEQIAIPVLKEQSDLLAQINRALDAMAADGELQTIHDRYFDLESAGFEPSEAIGLATIASLLARGFATTLGVAVVALLIGFLIAVPCGVILNRGHGVVYFVFRSGVDFIRGTPVLIQLLFVYYGTPHIGSFLFESSHYRALFMLAPLTAAVITLAINSASYMAEVVRSGLMSVDRGQTLAGRALGLTPFQVFRLIVWPQAFRIAIPPLVNSVVALTKDTALIMVISVREVVSAAQSIISVTFDPITYYFLVGVLFFMVTFPLMKLAGKLERHMKRKGFSS
jgi:His/Glu/Gln/Arg/opine family amino acid ABC transporter permease subunit